MENKMEYEKAIAEVVLFHNDRPITTNDSNYPGCVGNNFTGHSGSSPYQWGPYGC